MSKELQQPAQQEPVGKIVDCDFVGNSIARFERHLPFGTLLYTSPPAQRKPLTDEEKRELIKKSELWDMHVHIGWYSAPSKSFVEKAILFIADIEAAHGIKENT